METIQQTQRPGRYSEVHQYTRTFEDWAHLPDGDGTGAGVLAYGQLHAEEWHAT